MTATNDQDQIAPIEGEPLSFSLYREVHKGLRFALFALTTEVGAADVTDAGSRAALVAHVHRVLGMLNLHHDHEQDHIHPILAERAPTLAALVDEGHLETEADMIEIELRTDTLAGASGPDAVVAAWDLYGFLTMFVARYLAHMGLEEGAVMETLRDGLSLDDLMAVQTAIRSSIAPPTMCEFLTVLMPAVNIDERVNMLGGMRAVPPDIFEMFRAQAQASLSPELYSQVAVRLGLS